MIDLIFVALLQAAAGDPAQPAEQQEGAAPPAATAQQTTTQTPAEDGGVICRREQITGTRLTQRVCRTAAERQALEDESRDMLQRQQQMMPRQGN
jgi:hypothetical protein